MTSIRALLSLTALSFTTLSFATLAETTEPSTYTFPTSDAWLNHVQSGLMPYWMMEPAQGKPAGNFPTFRCDDGTLLNVSNVCPELKAGWITPHFDRDYTRMKSRQTYAYGVSYHLTGDINALALAKQGAYYLIDHLQDADNGGYISFTRNGQAGLEWQQRTSQDQAYALVGLAMYYYLTRDPKVEAALVKQQAFIFDNYRISESEGLAWVLKDGDGESNKQRELVAQLDQINGYLLLVAPLLPEKEKQRWFDDLQWLTEVMVDAYHSEKESRFYGAVHHKAAKMQNAKHNDFGHTIKAYWMTYLTAQTLEREGQSVNQEWESFAIDGMQETLKRAQYTAPFESAAHLFTETYQQKWQGHTVPAWQARPNSKGAASWEWAELDQASMTLSMHQDSLREELHYTTRTFMDVWVDQEHGGIGLNPKSTKAFHWGNGYHQFEHALVGYITASKLANQPFNLHYAFTEESAPSVQPYYFEASKIKVEQDKNTPNLQTITFQ
ncbi:N-acylglucosamine 2-epimerase [uncultured Vibrio sp.]|uniref:N-acylglucosamine 2-epimerase n=1 Tax=uncultured Vibrio sp. TaxID=114054 RepID=UPI0025FEC147|nr:N-acylglucosamine 2-epimerase [uncultured Vibrio sp.]